MVEIAFEQMQGLVPRVPVCLGNQDVARIPVDEQCRGLQERMVPGRVTEKELARRRMWLRPFNAVPRAPDRERGTNSRPLIPEPFGQAAQKVSARFGNGYQKQRAARPMAIGEQS